MCHDTATTYTQARQKKNPALSFQALGRQPWPMDLRWGRRRDMKKRLSIDSAGLVLFFFFFAILSPLFPIRHLSVEKGRHVCT